MSKPMEMQKVVYFSQGGTRLFGLVFHPKAGGSYPAIVYNHGSGQKVEKDNYWDLAQYFVDRDYIFFVPFRRGHGASDATSTGPFIGDQLDKLQGVERQVSQMALLQAQVPDVERGIAFLKNAAFHDTFTIGGKSYHVPESVKVIDDEMALMGSSYGGIMTVFTNSIEHGQKAAVAFSVGAESWDNSLLRAALKDAVCHNESPMFFLQAQDDVDTGPASELPFEMTRASSDPKHGRQFQAAIYPKVGTDDPHVTFAKKRPDLWGPAVVDFLNRYLH